MAEASLPVDQDQLCCPICLDVLKIPVTVPCGHSYCMRCIRGCWDREDRVGVYSCPECQQTFESRPVLGKNVMLAEIVDRAEERTQPGPERGATLYNVCPGGAQKAVRSCPRCVASYCDVHLQPHYHSPALRKHKLTDATHQLREMVCPLHKEPLKVYCRTDRRCICVLCVMEEHRHHDTVSAVAERAEMQKALGTAQIESRKSIQKREKELQGARQAVESLTRTAQAAVEDNKTIFASIIHLIETRCIEVEKLIQDQEKDVVGQAKGLQERLEREIAELRRRDVELEKLSHTEDHINFLQRWKFLCAPAGLCDAPCVALSPCLSFESVSRAISELRDQLEIVCQQELVKISETVSRVNEVAGLRSPKCKAGAEPILPNKVQILGIPGLPPLPEPKTREEFLRYARRLTLDPNTAHAELRLSAGDREVTRMRGKQGYPKSPERFDFKCQVLCREALSAGRCYWEAEVSGDKVEMAVTYKGIKRKGRDRASSFGGNDKSWSLDCIRGVYSVCHNDKGMQIDVPHCPRVGVYLDHSAGTLSFYSVSDTLTLLHRVRTVFTEPVYPGFWIGEQCSVKLCDSELPLMGGSSCSS